jgi:hypothetical protein
MELMNSDIDDLRNKNIEINNPTDISSTTNSDPNAENNSNTIQNFLSGVKNFFKPKTTSVDIEKDNKENKQDNSDNIESDLSKIEKEEELNKGDTCRDKLANKIISKLEVERSIPIFIVLLIFGIGLLIFSLFLLPLIIISPKKFSFCFAVGCILVLISFLFLVGTKTYVNKLLDNKRILFSISFILSIFIGIGFSLGSHYFISLICSGVQLISMIMFVLTFIPGGKAGIDCIKRTISSPFTKLFINKAKEELSEA